MSKTTFTMRQLLEAGVHFGHHPRRWNPKMATYLFGVRNNVHIIDLQQTVPLLYRALEAIKEIVSKGGRILFVGTKHQASGPIAEAATSCGQYYVNHRWLGGMLTNWGTISKSINRLEELEKKLDQQSGFTKKEHLKLSRERQKLEMTLGGIRSMGGRPNALFVIDTNKEALAIEEAHKLGIPVIAVVDSNSNPEKVDYVIPGNDDASRAINLYCQLVVLSVLEGLQAEIRTSGVDVGTVQAPIETIAEFESVEVLPEAGSVTEEIIVETPQEESQE
ncbi:MAG: 30S ribosomal protein S2 [Alphaproteobacteria bacterium RIFCSPLOWO2_01_FULL_45_8]|nr:MAG: 30S ribosomal protein S2 [Alphaproteobacteria bacterium GWA1_45_9]OFW89781.1 MAG: 30S ribosomal protein S2 [Alphaproteobacteria bacterium RIFCSPHIGHO2_01_FULL_41_14]OFW95993.1 MAG: 30S ribosomal protein S2 [Alphaproteobacteria bacterium RIFCSPLOWO2_01_FULL_45_8]HCI48833.1 30S ribosomal protein S2 [Holosporales bacterium]